jgi:RND family efflux transporter MFP subunit
MKGNQKNRFKLPAKWASALLTGILLSQCEKPTIPVPPPPLVQVQEVSKGKVERSTTFIGKLDSPQNVEVRARVESFLDKILFEEGSEVKAGDLLFELDKKPYEEQLAAAKGALAQAQAGLSKSKIDVPRLKVLVAQNAAPQRELDAALSTEEANAANVASAEAKVKSAELDLGYCEVRAPLSGRIGAKSVSVGSLVGKGEPTLLATISQVDPIWFYCSISEVDYLNAERMASEAGRKLGELPAHLILADGSKHPDVGKWVFVDRIVDVTTATIRIRAEFPNSRRALRPGMFARVQVSLPSEEEPILVPERALVELQGKSFVWVVSAEGKGSQRPVEVAATRYGANVIVLKGLEVGERIVVEGLQKLREGAPVQAMTAEGMAAAAAANAAKAQEAKEETKKGKE